MNRIDSNLFQPSPQDQPLLAFGSYLQGLFQVPLTSPSMNVDGHATQIAHNSSDVAMEAAFQFSWTVKDKIW